MTVCNQDCPQRIYKLEEKDNVNSLLLQKIVTTGESTLNKILEIQEGQRKLFDKVEGLNERQIKLEQIVTKHSDDIKAAHDAKRDLIKKHSECTFKEHEAQQKKINEKYDEFIKSVNTYKYWFFTAVGIAIISAVLRLIIK